MSFPNKSSVRCGLIGVFILILLGAIFGSLTSATLVLTGTVFSPAPPIVPGSGQYAISSATIIPSGATTFSRTHMLQMQTGLDDAKWNIQIIVNGIPAAQQSASGATAFINGYLLSYPTTSDVSITIAINGTVPANASGNVTILNLIELDRYSITRSREWFYSYIPAHYHFSNPLCYRQYCYLCDNATWINTSSNTII